MGLGLGARSMAPLTPDNFQRLRGRFTPRSRNTRESGGPFWGEHMIIMALCPIPSHLARFTELRPYRAGLYGIAWRTVPSHRRDYRHRRRERGRTDQAKDCRLKGKGERVAKAQGTWLAVPGVFSQAAVR